MFPYMFTHKIKKHNTQHTLTRARTKANTLVWGCMGGGDGGRGAVADMYIQMHTDMRAHTNTRACQIAWRNCCIHEIVTLGMPFLKQGK